MRPIWVIGAGGHAKVVVDTLRSAGGFEVVGALDDDPNLLGASVLGVPVVGPASPESIARLGVEFAILAVGSNRARAALAARLDGIVSWGTAIHPRAYLAEGTLVGEGTVVFAGAVVQPGATLGAHVILNTSSSVDHDSVVGDFAHLAPGVHLAGTVTIGEGALLGVGAGVLPGRSVGPWASVAAGAVVARDVPGGVVAKGVPARWDGPLGGRAC